MSHPGPRSSALPTHAGLAPVAEPGARSAEDCNTEESGGANRRVGRADSVPVGFRRRQRLATAAVVLPALAAAYGSFVLGGLDSQSAGRAAVLGFAILATGALLKRFTYPHRLMPVSRILVAIIPALGGAFVAGMLAISDVQGLAATGLLPATVLALATAVAVEVMGHRFLAEHPLRVAVLGSPSFASGLRREIAADPTAQVEVVGWLNPVSGTYPGQPAGPGGESAQIGTLDSIRSAITESEIDLIVRGPGIDGTPVSRRTYDAIAQGCMDLPVRMIDGNQFYEHLFGHVPLGTIGSDWFLYMKHPSFESTPPASKRAFDLIGATLMAIVALPLVAAAALAIKLEDRGSVLYRQRRVGAGGRDFEIIKLRTMRENAESDGVRWSVAADERITRVGRLLRRLHIDELPQLVNVLRGEMTLVGPRPERPEIIARLERQFPHYQRRMLVKPGVTGWAQVRCGYAGSELGTAWKLCHDLFYLKHRSLLADCLIMIETLAIAAEDSHRELRAPQPEFIFAGGEQGAEDHEAVSPGGGIAGDAERVPDVATIRGRSFGLKARDVA